MRELWLKLWTTVRGDTNFKEATDNVYKAKQSLKRFFKLSKKDMRAAAKENARKAQLNEALNHLIDAKRGFQKGPRKGTDRINREYGINFQNGSDCSLFMREVSVMIFEDLKNDMQSDFPDVVDDIKACHEEIVVCDMTPDNSFKVNVLNAWHSMLDEQGRSIFSAKQESDKGKISKFEKAYEKVLQYDEQKINEILEKQRLQEAKADAAEDAARKKQMMRPLMRLIDAGQRQMRASLLRRPNKQNTRLNFLN